MESTNVQEILTNLQNTDNAVRGQAEQQLNKMRAEAAPQLCEGLMAAIAAFKDNKNEATAQLACVMLKKLFLDGRKEEENFAQLDATQITALKNQFKSSMDLEEPMGLLRAKAQIICKLHKKEESYAEVVTQLRDLLSQSGDDEKTVKGKEFALYMFELLAEYHLPQEQINENSAQFVQLFQQSMQDSNEKIKVAALKALTAFLTSIDDDELIMQYEGMMSDLLDIVISVLKADETKGQASLESMIELTQSFGEIWHKCAQKLIFTCSQIMSNSNFEDETRQSALEIISTLAENSPQVLRENQNDLKEHFFAAIAQMLTEPANVDDPQAWADEVEEEELQAKNDPCSVASEALSRIADDLGEKTTIACVTDLIKQAISNEKWTVRQAGFLMLGMVADTCEKTFRKNRDEIIKMAAGGVLDAEARVRYESLTCLGLLLNVLSPEAQLTFHAEMVPMLLKLMKDEQLMKMKTRAVQCMTNFVRGLFNEDDEQGKEDVPEDHKNLLNQYADEMVQTISDLFQLSIDQNYAPLQGEALALLSCLANVLQTYFVKYYNKFMPGLINILQTAPFETTAQQELRSNCIQTVGFVLEAVHDQKELAEEGANQVAQLLLQMIESGKLSESDPQINSSMHTLSQVAFCLGEKFEPYLERLMPQLLKDASADVDLKIVDASDADAEEAEDGRTAMKIKVKGFEQAKQISMNTTALEAKLSAVQIIRSICKNMNKGFFKHVEAVVNLIVSDLLAYKYSSSVRKEAAKCLCHLLGACSDSNQMKALWTHFSPVLLKEINARLEAFDFISVRWQMRELMKCIKQFEVFHLHGESFMTEQHGQELVTFLKKVVTTVQKDKEARLEQFETAKKKMNEEDIEYFHEDLEKMDRCWNYAMDINGVLLKTMSAAVSATIQSELLPLYGAKLLTVKADQSPIEEQEQLNSLCFLSDCMEFGSNDLFQATSAQAGDKLLEFIDVKLSNQAMSQTCIFGLGVLAARLPRGQFPLVDKTLIAIDAVIKQHPSGTSNVADNAYSTLGKLVYFQVENVDIANKFLAALPLKTDNEEAQAVHYLFFDQIAQKNALLMQVAPQVKTAAMAIADLDTKEPKLEILSDKGRAKFQEIQGMLA